jgi:ATP-dependent Clp protease ATP-binding subunit ClpA
MHTEDLKLTLVLFDEIEKASDALWQLLLGILDKATLTLGDNRRVDFSKCMVIMTSNLGRARDVRTDFRRHRLCARKGREEPARHRSRSEDLSHGGRSGATQVLA